MEKMNLEQVRENFSYNPDTGVLKWIVQNKHHPRLYGKEAGSISDNGYRVVRWGGRSYKAHRLAYLHYHGEWPDKTDHINGKKLDNRIENLRSVDHSQNAQNVVGRGVRETRAGRYEARIRIGGKLVCLGTFEDFSKARAKYVSAKKQHHDAPRITLEQ